ncbi:hypothetical protein QO002_002153 [Pararhizobium capsulatum DSM 1112]|uniref:Uncharacterized protein n=1 Tax=Pararhizobium capsulatum DSM 1112 TaxID=1121113 RepID=A0ABU0BR99_9HYPH|nr:hypothetical protein [Pararhizobium capsulatum]MDQ0320015.1 hypothetical protein [Pararhizobium capsulatum DSM 1112]
MILDINWSYVLVFGAVFVVGLFVIASICMMVAAFIARALTRRSQGREAENRPADILISKFQDVRKDVERAAGLQ